MVSLNVSEQELFDLIMTLYAAEDSADAGKEADEANRREALLDKLHDAFEPQFSQ